MTRFKLRSKQLGLYYSKNNRLVIDRECKLEKIVDKEKRMATIRADVNVNLQEQVWIYQKSNKYGNWLSRDQMFQQFFDVNYY